MEFRLNAGSEPFNKLLAGGYESGVLTTIYGPASSGKTTACLMASVQAAATKKVIYIDSEGGFSVERLAQICPTYKKVLDNMLFLKPATFEEQKKIFARLRGLVTEKIVLVTADTISNLYRQEVVDSKIQDVNRQLALQISYLVEIARKKNIPVLVTAQVYSSFDERDKINMVGGDLLRYQSKCLVELQNNASGFRKAILMKHRSLPESSINYRIVESGFVQVKEKLKSLF